MVSVSVRRKVFYVRAIINGEHTLLHRYLMQIGSMLRHQKSRRSRRPRISMDKAGWPGSSPSAATSSAAAIANTACFDIMPSRPRHISARIMQLFFWSGEGSLRRRCGSPLPRRSLPLGAPHLPKELFLQTLYLLFK